MSAFEAAETSSSLWGGGAASASSGGGDAPSSGVGYGGFGGFGGAAAGGAAAGGAPGGSADPAEIAACLGMGDFLPEGRGGGASSAYGLMPQARAAGGGAEIPSEVTSRAGTEFAHDGGYSYRITSDGGFEITVAPGDKGIGYVITQHGDYATAWQTLADFVVAMGPSGGGAAPKGDAKDAPKGSHHPTKGVPWGAKPAPGDAGHDGDGGGKPEKAPASETEKNRPKRPSNPGAQMSSLLTAAKAGAGSMQGLCYRFVKGYIKAAGGYGDILDIYTDERFAGFQGAAVDFAAAVATHGAAALGLEEVGGLPMSAAPGTILVTRGNGKVNLSQEYGDIAVISGVEDGCVICYNDGRMKLSASTAAWTSGDYVGVLVGMYRPIQRK